MRRARFALPWFLLGALSMALIGLGLTLVLTGAFVGRRASDQLVYAPVIHIHNAQDVETVRRELIVFLFGTSSLPATLPEVRGGDRLLVPLPNGFTSSITIYRPEDDRLQPNGALVIYHTGHDGFTNRDLAAIRAYQRAGYAVWRLDMLLLGDNPSELLVTIPGVGTVPIHQHRQLAFLAGIAPGSPLRYFVEPVVAAINLAGGRGYTDIFMTGLSGGGRTTILAAAIDPRLRARYPVAGGVPLALRFDRYQKNWGDWEENLPELQRIASFEDLSVLGAAGRSQIQVLNEFDICCYNEPRYRSYEPDIRQAVEALDGHFEIYWSQGEFLHRTSPAALQVILADMQLRRTP